MVEGDEGHVETEHQCQQRDLIETTWHKGQPHCQKAASGGKGDHRRRQEIGADDQQRGGEGILQIADKITERHLCQPCADRAADGELRQNHEFIHPRQLGPAGQMKQGRQPDRTQKMRHRHPADPGQQKAGDAKPDKGRDLARRQGEDARHVTKRDIRAFHRLAAFD